MSTCFLKRFLPFMLTFVIGLGLGSLFGYGYQRPQYTARLYAENSCRHRAHYSFAPRDVASDSTPLAILFEPRTHMTTAALRHQTYGVVQLLVEYGADGQARVMERVTTLPDGLTEEAERVAAQTQFRPATINGAPVSTTKLQPFYFDMSRF